MKRDRVPIFGKPWEKIEAVGSLAKNLIDPWKKMNLPFFDGHDLIDGPKCETVRDADFTSESPLFFVTEPKPHYGLHTTGIILAMVTLVYCFTSFGWFDTKSFISSVNVSRCS